VIWANNTVVYPLLYMQEVMGKGKRVYVISGIASSAGAPVFNTDSADEILKRYDFYVVSPDKSGCPEFVLEDHDFVSDWPLYKAVGKDD